MNEVKKINNSKFIIIANQHIKAHKKRLSNDESISTGLWVHDLKFFTPDFLTLSNLFYLIQTSFQFKTYIKHIIFFSTAEHTLELEIICSLYSWNRRVKVLIHLLLLSAILRMNLWYVSAQSAWLWELSPTVFTDVDIHENKLLIHIQSFEPFEIILHNLSWFDQPFHNLFQKSWIDLRIILIKFLFDNTFYQFLSLQWKASLGNFFVGHSVKIHVSFRL